MNAIKNWSQMMETPTLNKQVAGKIRDIYYLTAKIHHTDIMESRQAAFTAIQHICHLGSDDTYAFGIRADKEIYRACTNMRPSKGNKDGARFNLLQPLKLKMDREFIPRQYFCDKQRRDFIIRVVETLSFKKKVCLLLYYYRKLSFDEIMYVTGMGQQAVKHQLKGIQAHITHLLKKQYDDYTELISSYEFEVIGEPVLSQILQRDSSIVEKERLDELTAYAEKCMPMNEMPFLQQIK